MASSGRGATPLLILIAGIALASLSAGYGERVFNANTQGGQTLDVGATQSVGQSFAPADSFILRNVTLLVENQPEFPPTTADFLNVTVQADDGTGKPDGVVLGGSDQIRTEGSGMGWLDFPLTPWPTLDAGFTYWIVARDAKATGLGYAWARSSGSVVPGEAKSEILGTWTSVGADMVFITFGLRLEPEMSVGLAVDRLSVAPGSSVTYTVHMNNTASRPAPNAWVNLTLDAGLQYASDTAGSLGGTSIGPNSWQIPQVGNGPNSFTVTAIVDSQAAGGDFLNSTVHLDYTDSAGVPQQFSTTTATVIVALKPKFTYLTHDGLTGQDDALRASAPTNPPMGPVPDFDGDGNQGTTAGNLVAIWTLDPPFAHPFRIRGAVTVELFLNAPNGGGSSAVLNVSLYDRRGLAATYIASVFVSVSVDGLDTTYELRAVDLGIVNRLFSDGNTTELRIVKDSGTDLWIGYDRTDLPSRVIATTSTYISVDRVDLFDGRGPATAFSAKDTVRIEANVSDPFGNGEIAGVRVNISDPQGVPVVVDAPMTAIAADPAGAWTRFRFLYPNPVLAGPYGVLITATEGNGVESSTARTFLVAFPVIQLAVSVDVPSPRVGGIVTFSVTHSNVGSATAPRAWLNVTLPSELSYVSDSSSGVRTGASNWTLADVEPGFHAFNLVAQIRGAPSNGTLFVRFDLAFSDPKGFVWQAPVRSAELAVIPPPPPNPFSNPVVLFLIGVAVAGGFAGGYWVWRSRQPAVEEAFLIHRDGVLLYHVSRSLGGEGEKDRDILGAMLTAVQDFVKDSFKYGEHRDLHKLEFGDYEVIIERGGNVFLAVVLSSKIGEADIRRRLRRVLDEVEARFGKELADWGGDMEPILGVRDIVRHLVARR